MKRRHITWLLFSVGACLVCAVGAVLVYQSQCPNPANVETVIPDNADVEITLERTICFGNCPSYTLTIDGSGSIVYNGRSYVQEKGRREGQMSQQDYQRLVDAFEIYNFYALSDLYRRAANPICDAEEYEYWTDAPYVAIGLSVNDRLTEIEHYHGLRNAPAELTELENLVDEMAHSERWVK
ncbi:MAG: hypothetical protein GY803_14525 [Chloroflexi bacterium]|nr:hypothetical protein [Chloroflexota bacterium]